MTKITTELSDFWRLNADILKTAENVKIQLILKPSQDQAESVEYKNMALCVVAEPKKVRVQTNRQTDTHSNFII